MFSQDEINEIRSDLDWHPVSGAPSDIEWTFDQYTAGQIVQKQYGFDHEQGLWYCRIHDRSDNEITFQYAEDK